MTNEYSLPDFLIIGAGKSGTTSLDQYLQQHPKLFMSRRKEPNFFAYESIPETALNKYISRHYYQSIVKLNDYQKLFAGAKKNQLLGEVSNTYLVMDNAAERIKYYVPNVKLIAILRQPAERLYSRYLHLARENRLPSKDFRTVFDKNSIWWKRNDLIKEGFYFKNLSRFYSLFPPENIRVYFNEDLKNRPKELINDICSFLSIEEIAEIDYSIKYNRSGLIRNRWYDMTLGHNSIIKETLKAVLPSIIYTRAKENLRLHSLVTTLKDYNLNQPKLDVALKRRITEEIYGEDIKNLQCLLNTDLTHWLNFEEEIDATVNDTVEKQEIINYANPREIWNLILKGIPGYQNKNA